MNLLFLSICFRAIPPRAVVGVMRISPVLFSSPRVPSSRCHVFSVRKFHVPIVALVFPLPPRVDCSDSSLSTVRALCLLAYICVFLFFLSLRFCVCYSVLCFVVQVFFFLLHLWSVRGSHPSNISVLRALSGQVSTVCVIVRFEQLSTPATNPLH